MWGASIYIEKIFELPEKEAGDILCNWITNYDKLAEKYDWFNDRLKTE
jgi:hypothetical protein